MSRRNAALVTVGLLITTAAFDFIRYRSNVRRAVEVVNELEGRMGSLGGWPLGEEVHVTFDRPLGADEVARLTCLSTIRGGAAAVGFTCPVPDSEIAAFRTALPGVWVGCLAGEAGGGSDAIRGDVAN